MRLSFKYTVIPILRRVQLTETKAEILMARNTSVFVIFFIALLYTAHALSRKGKALKSKTEELKKILKIYNEFEAQASDQIGQVLMMIDKHSAEVMNTSAEAVSTKDRAEFETKAAGLLERVENVQDILEGLVPIVIRETAVNIGEQTTDVPVPEVFVTVNSSAQLSYDSNGKLLIICVWEHLADGHQVVIQNEERHGDGTPAEGSWCLGGGLNNGKCRLKIESVTSKHLGRWSCTLITNDGQVLTGEVNVKTYAINLQIYFATKGEGIKAYSLSTSNINTIVNSTEALHGITYDAIRHRLYWTSKSKIYRSEIDGTGVETLLSTRKYGKLRGLGFDSITGNLYVVSDGGHILVCNGKEARKFRCAAILSGQGVLRGIVLDSTEGTMYWTRKGGSILKANMDGSDNVTFIEGLNDPRGIIIDSPAARLYWADYSSKTILSCSSHGGEVVTVAEVRNGPFGLALAGQTLYWGLASSKTIQSSTKEGCDIRTVYNGSAVIWHLAVSSLSIPSDRSNPCEEGACDGICALTSTAYSCV